MRAMANMLVYMHEIAESGEIGVDDDTLRSSILSGDTVLESAPCDMSINAGYLFRADVEVEEHIAPLVVTAAGRYRMISRECFETTRWHGRCDYQLLYVASGKATFHHGGVARRVSAGTMVVYRPGEPQRYEYRSADQTEVYWVHFSGADASTLAQVASDGFVDAGVSAEYGVLFGRIIGELQLRRAGFEELIALDLRRVLALARRHVAENAGDGPRGMPSVVRDAVTYLHEHVAERFSVEEYSATVGLSVSRFIHVFREATGVSPKRYLTSIRMSEARMLLESTDYPIAEIGDIVGYDDPLYFSRVFRAHVGMSPSQCREESVQR